jgi:parallel beta-helix repeat protein
MITINALTYNLDNTGKIDSTLNFQNMINSFPSGSDLRIPAGTYKINGTIYLNTGIKIEAQSDVIFIGIGTNDLFNANSNTTFSGLGFQNCNNAININGVTGITVYWCNFKNNIVYSAVNIYNGTNIAVTNSYFYNILKNGVMVNGNSSTINIQWNTFSNPSAFGNYATAQISGHVYCLSGTKITVDHNTANSNGGEGIIFCYNSTTNMGVTNSVISNNHCEGNGEEGCTTYGGSNKISNNNSIINNTCINNRYHQIEIWQSDNNIITGNTVTENISGRGNIGAITLYNSTGTTCTGNKIISAENNGMAILAGSLNCTVSNNIIQNTNMCLDVATPQKGNGILMDWDCLLNISTITIDNNTISSTGGIINKSGIYSTCNTNEHNIISGNVITGYTTGVHQYAQETCGA